MGASPRLKSSATSASQSGVRPPGDTRWPLLFAFLFCETPWRKLLAQLLLYRRPLLNIHDSLPTGDAGSFPILRHQVRILIKYQDQAVLLGSLENVGLAALEVRHYPNLAAREHLPMKTCIIKR